MRASSSAAWLQVRPFAVTTAMVGAAAVAAHFCEPYLAPQSLALIFVAPMVVAAMRYGLRAALAASLLSVAAINFLFVEPRYTLVVARVQDLGALLLFAAVSVLVSFIAERARALDAARDEAARERFKSELLEGVSHDLRTPLATILFTLQSLQRFAEQSPETRRELIDLAESEARRLTTLVDTLLSASRLEAGASAVLLEPVSIGDIASAVLADMKNDGSGPPLTVAIPEDLPLALADQALAARALSNLVANAVKYGGHTPISIAARCENHRIIVDVADRGPGLGNHPERLFDKFVRGVAGDGRAPGLGLGLSLARSFMQSQGGLITAANREGGGALFSLSFPCWTQAARHGS
ncbi:MAG TPA: DUF4118 domain-containing protein [Vitreimonas sp.]|nr:DUF4118 domain-containing protein [Vitreimonas sp.]